MSFPLWVCFMWQWVQGIWSTSLGGGQTNGNADYQHVCLAFVLFKAHSQRYLVTLATALQGKLYPPHFTDEDTEAQVPLLTVHRKGPAVSVLCSCEPGLHQGISQPGCRALEWVVAWRTSQADVPPRVLLYGIRCASGFLCLECSYLWGR